MSLHIILGSSIASLPILLCSTDMQDNYAFNSRCMMQSFRGFWQIRSQRQTFEMQLLASVRDCRLVRPSSIGASTKRLFARLSCVTDASKGWTEEGMWFSCSPSKSTLSPAGGPLLSSDALLVACDRDMRSCRRPGVRMRPD